MIIRGYRSLDTNHLFHLEREWRVTAPKLASSELSQHSILIILVYYRKGRKNIIIDVSNIGQNYQEHKLVSPLSSEQSILSLPFANYQTRGGGIELSDTHAHFPGFNWNILEISDLSFSVKLGNIHLRSCTLHLGIAQTDMIFVTSSTSSASVKYFLDLKVVWMLKFFR